MIADVIPINRHRPLVVEPTQPELLEPHYIKAAGEGIAECRRVLADAKARRDAQHQGRQERHVAS
jgi:hypothetical protein